MTGADVRTESASPATTAASRRSPARSTDAPRRGPCHRPARRKYPVSRCITAAAGSTVSHAFASASSCCFRAGVPGLLVAGDALREIASNSLKTRSSGMSVGKRRQRFDRLRVHVVVRRRRRRDTARRDRGRDWSVRRGPPKPLVPGGTGIGGCIAPSATATAIPMIIPTTAATPSHQLLRLQSDQTIRQSDRRSG